MWQEIRYGARALRRDPGYTLLAVGVLALGIGANSAMFSVVDGVMLKPLPFPQADRLVMLREFRPAVGETSVSSPDFLDWQKMVQTFDSLSATSNDSANTITGYGPTRVVRSLIANRQFFSIFGARMQKGRMFTEAEEMNHKSGSVAIVSDAFWRNELASDAEIIGKFVMAYGQRMEIVGILAPGFHSPWESDIFFCFDLLRGTGTRETGLLDVTGRLRPGVPLARAKAEMDAVAAKLAQEHPSTNRETRVTVKPLQNALVQGASNQLLILMSATGLVMLLGCVNLAHLTLARATVRQSELAIRIALGASRKDLIRHILAETLVLISLGGSVGLFVAWASIGPFVRWCPYKISGLAEVLLDWRAALFTAFVSILSAVLLSSAPVVHALRMNLNRGLRESSNSVTGGRGLAEWARSAMFVSQIALALMLVAGTGLLLRSLVSALNVAPGFQPDHLMTIERGLTATPQFFEQLLERIQRLPGVSSVSLATRPPLTGSGGKSLYMDAATRPVDWTSGNVDLTSTNFISRDYFQTIQTPLIEGRYFAVSDNRAVAIVNETMARRFSPDGHAIGKRIRLKNHYDNPEVMEIIGIVRDVNQSALDTQVRPDIYRHLMTPEKELYSTVVIRSALGAGTLLKPVQQIVQELDKEQPTIRLVSYADIIESGFRPRKFITFLLTLFGGIAVVLAGTGVFGVMAFTVARRRREVAIRMALGARQTSVLQMILMQGLRLAAIGTLMGLAGAWGVTRVMESLLFAVTPHDPVTLVGATVVLVCTSLLASLVPAWRASRIDPVAVMKI